MSWLFSQALVEAFSEENSWDGEPSAPLNVMPTPHKFWRNDKTMECSTLSQFGLTCAVLTEDRGAALLTSFLEASRARTSAPQGREPELRVNDPASGLNLLGSLAKWDRGLSSWRTPGGLFMEGSIEFLETWPTWGSMRSGVCWARNTPALYTPGIEFGYWPTPTASMAKRGWGFVRETQGRYSQSVIQRARVDGWLPSPQLLEALMGWPIEWTALAPLETVRFQEWSNSHFQPSTAA